MGRPDRWDQMWSGSNKETRKDMVAAELRSRDNRQGTVRLAVGTVLSVFPLGVVWLIVRSVAGKETIVNVTIALSLVVSVSILEGLMIWRQRRQIKRLRSRVRSLESENRVLKAERGSEDGDR